MAASDIAPRPSPEKQEPQAFQVYMGRVSRHSAVFFLGTIFSAVTAYGFKIYLARVLGAYALGIYALGMTIVGLVSIFNILGLPQAALRFVPAYCATGQTDLLRVFLVKSVRTLLFFNFVLALVMWFVGPWISSRFYHTPELGSYMGLFAFIMLLGVLNMFFGNVLAGYKNVARRTVIINFVGSPLVILVTFGLVTAGWGLRGYIVAQVVNAGVILALLVAASWRLTPPSAHSLSPGPSPFPKEVVSFSTTVLGLGLLQFLMSRADSIAIGYYLPPKQLGVYAAASAVVVFVSIVLRSVNQIFAPTVSDLHSRQDFPLLKRMYQTLAKWVIGLTVPLAATMVVFAAPLMRIFGREFEAGWPVLAIGTIGQLVNCGVGSSGTMLFMSGNQKSLIRIEAAAAVVMVLLNVALVPRWGIVGAAVAAAITVALTNLAYLYRVWRRLGLLPYNPSHLRLALPLVGSVGLLVLVKHLGGAIHPPWLVIGVGLILSYLAFMALALVFGLDSDDRTILRTLWARKAFGFSKLEVTTPDE